MILRQRSLALLIGAALVSLPLSTFAQGAGYGHHFYGSASLGRASFDSSTDESDNFDGDVDEDTTAWSLGVGATFNEYVGVELAYVDLDEFTYDGLYMGTSSEGSVEVDGWELSVLGKWPVSEENNLSAYARLGVFMWDATEEEEFGGVDEPTDEEDGSDPVYGFGLAWGLSDVVELRAEWKRTEVWDDDVDVFSAQAIWFPAK